LALGRPDGRESFSGQFEFYVPYTFAKLKAGRRGIFFELTLVVKVDARA
jgi:hypothetical protein